VVAGVRPPEHLHDLQGRLALRHEPADRRARSSRTDAAADRRRTRGESRAVGSGARPPPRAPGQARLALGRRRRRRDRRGDPRVQARSQGDIPRRPRRDSRLPGVDEHVARGAPVRPVFVVGASRSGTNLVRAILNAHSTLWISAETHYFDDLRPRLGERARVPLAGAVRDECERYFLAQSHRAYGRGGDPQQGRIAAAELRALAQRLGGSGDAYFEAFGRLRAELHGKPAWGEKTPRHAYRIADVLDVFPDARIVCLLRDPRAVVASYRDWHRGAPRDWLDEENAAGLAAERERSRRSYHPLLASLLWRGVVRAERDAERRFGRARVIVLRFEELAADPEACVRGLCERLGLEFEQQMLEVPVVNSSYAAA